MKPGDEVAGRYELGELQGGGGMSHVWRAHDRTLDRTVALKMLSPTADLERFQREARAVASLSHENVMRVFDYGEDAAGPYMALEWLHGGTLEDRLAHGALPYSETARIATGIAAGLAHLHERGFVHRDLKTANVLFDDEGRPKVGDLGLARAVTGPGTLTEAGTVLGTAAYISPEQAAGKPATPASDVYSFGVILFRMLTGALPFVADEALALLDMHRRKPAPSVAELRPDAPPHLAALADAALQKDPARRPADGAALLAGLGAAAPIAAGPETTETRVLPAAAAAATDRPARRRTAAVAAALVVLAATGGLLAWAVTRTDSAAPAGVSTHTGPFGTHRKGTTGSSLPTTTPTTQATSTAATTSTSTTTPTTAPRTTTTVPATTATIPTTTATTPTTTPTTTATTPGTTASTAPATAGATGTTAPVSTPARTSRYPLFDQSS